MRRPSLALTLVLAYSLPRRFADMSKEEFKSFLGVVPSMGPSDDIPVLEASMNVSALSGSFNWNDQGVLTPVKDQAQWSNVILCILDEVSMISLKENARLARSAARGRGLTTAKPNFGDVGVLYLGDFAQMPPIGEDGLFKFAHFRQPEDRQKAVVAWLEDRTKGQVQVDGHRFWHENTREVYFIEKQCRARVCCIYIERGLT